MMMPISILFLDTVCHQNSKHTCCFHSISFSSVARWCFRFPWVDLSNNSFFLFCHFHHHCFSLVSLPLTRVTTNTVLSLCFYRDAPLCHRAHKCNPYFMTESNVTSFLKSFAISLTIIPISPKTHSILDLPFYKNHHCQPCVVAICMWSLHVGHKLFERILPLIYLLPQAPWCNGWL